MIETLTVAEATEWMRAEGIKISPELLRDGIEQGAYPFGTYIKSRHGGKVYQIYKKQFDEWIDERRSE